MIRTTFGALRASIRQSIELFLKVLPLGLAGLLAVGGTAHFVLPKPYDALVPPQLPGPKRAYTQASGAAELAVAAAIAIPATRRVGGYGAAALFVAVFPANIYMVRLWKDKHVALRVIAWLRLPLQVPLILAGLGVAWTARRGK